MEIFALIFFGFIVFYLIYIFTKLQIIQETENQIYDAELKSKQSKQFTKNRKDKK